MPLLTWNSSCAVGVRAMDEQHGILMDAMNEVRLSVVRGCGREQLSERMKRLIQLVGLHFHSEEQLMERNGFPGLEEHHEAHLRLLHSLRESARRAQHDPCVQLTPMLRLMRDEYLEHIGGLDQEYGPFLNLRGVD